MKDTVISLCDYTGKMVQPWLETGYSALIVDPQHTHTHTFWPYEVRRNHRRGATYDR